MIPWEGTSEGELGITCFSQNNLTFTREIIDDQNLLEVFYLPSHRRKIVNEMRHGGWVVMSFLHKCTQEMTKSTVNVIQRYTT
jgi:hypothetical protein